MKLDAELIERVARDMYWHTAESYTQESYRRNARAELESLIAVQLIRNGFPDARIVEGENDQG